MGKIRTDLALEDEKLQGGDQKKLPGVKVREEKFCGFPRISIRITNEKGASSLGRPIGRYETLELTPLENGTETADRAAEAVAKLLRPMLLPDRAPILVAGLGNRSVTPDAVGPLCADRLLVTRHLVQLAAEHFGSWRPVAALAPGVLASTGMESGELIRSAIRAIGAAQLIAVDALAARNLGRLCTTIQISDTGIAPGSGVGNHRTALDQTTMGIPVVAVGVPTVVDGATLAAGLLEAAGAALPDRLHTFPGASLLVAPSDVDRRVERVSVILARGLNLALQTGLTTEELERLLA